MQKSLNFNSAIQIHEQVKKEKTQFDKEYKENIENAHDELWDRMGSEDFRMSDFDDICGDYGLDADDLFHRMI